MKNQQQAAKINVNLLQLRTLLKLLVDQFNQAINLLFKKCTYSLEKELNLLKKIHNYCKFFLEKSCFDLKNECDRLFGRVETKLIEEMLVYNDAAIKHLDHYLERGNNNNADEPSNVDFDEKADEIVF
jgi:hypothetical protein